MSNISYAFDGRTVVVTGSARGIGKEVARLFVEARAAVYLMDPDADEVNRAADELGATAIVGNVSSTEDAESAIAQMVRDTGRVDIVVNNAGILRDAVLWKISDADWESVIAVHLAGTFKMTRAAVPHFRSQAFGRVINVTSYTGLRGNFGQANYGAAKAGIIGFTKTAAKELAGFGVTVNAISPNAETRMIASIPAATRERLTAEIPLKRFAEPREMADAVAFLASDEASYITGVILPVDGGISM